jgi:iron complex outermembrane recepter protein
VRCWKKRELHILIHHHTLRRALRQASSYRTLAFACAGFGLAVAAMPAHAQTASATGPVNLDLGAVLATGTGSAANLASTPGTAPYNAPSLTPLNSTQPTSVVTKHTINNLLTPTESYADAARLTPSVNNINPNGPGLMESNGPSIRGFTDGQYNVTFDGIPIGDSNDFTHHTTSFFANEDIGQVIVDRGPGTAETVGDATFGGTISIRTIDPSPVTTITPSGSYGSYDTGTENLRVDTGSIQAANGSTAVFDAEHLGSNGALSNATQERTNFFGKVVVPVSDNTTVTFLADYNRLYQNPAAGATLAQMAEFGQNFAFNTDPNSPDFNRYNTDHITTDMEYVDIASHLNDGWLYDGKIYTYAYYHEDLNGDDATDSGELPGTKGVEPDMVELTPGGTAVPGVPGNVFKNTYRSVGTIQRAEKDFDWGDIKLGAWFDHQVNTRFVQNVDLSDGNAINFDPADSNGGQGTFTLKTPGETASNLGTPLPGFDNDDGSIERLQHNQLYTFQPYAQVDYNPIENLTLTGGVKYAFFRRTGNDQVQQKTEEDVGFSHDWGKFLPSFEAKYSFSPNLSTYAQVAEGFLAPNLNTFDTTSSGSQSFAPETTWSYQTGMAYQGQHLALGSDVYLVHFTNFIQGVANPNMPGSENDIFVNSGGAVYKGIEAEATYTFDSGVSFFANGGLNKSNLTQGNVNISGAPQGTWNLGMIYNKNGYYASVIDQWTGGEYGSAPPLSNNPREPGQWYNPYNVVNLALGYTFGLNPHLKQINVKLNLDNITNQKQIIYDNGTNDAGDALYYALQGTSAFFTVTVPLTF